MVDADSSLVILRFVVFSFFVEQQQRGEKKETKRKQ